MGQVLHGSATTTEAVRRAIQHSQASLRALARRHGINQKTVAKWKKRTSTADLPTGPKVARSTVLSIEISRLRARLGLLQKPDDLLFREPRSLHRPSSFKGRTLIHHGGKSGGHVKRTLPLNGAN